MAVIVYGTHVFTKLAGYFGPREECPVCHRVYKKGYVRITRWAHLEYIPLFPYKKTYFKMCPVCGMGVELKNKEAKAEMAVADDGYRQDFEAYAKHVLAKKPTGLLATDNSYEFWIKDLMTGEEIRVESDITKDQVKRIKKNRGYKKVPIVNA
ncbi:MAG: zinc ribbon domain-containing protein [Lachnospiraceae bacterium]|nr:zinc ribbon domain-containing protein [Lachnospiraceae bacterium]